MQQFNSFLFTMSCHLFKRNIFSLRWVTIFGVPELAAPDSSSASAKSACQHHVHHVNIMLSLSTSCSSCQHHVHHVNDTGDDVGVIRWGKRPWRCGRRWWQWSCGCGWCWCWWWSWRKSQIPGGCLTEALLSVFYPVKSLHVTKLFSTLLKVYMSPNSFQPALILFFSS